MCPLLDEFVQSPLTGNPFLITLCPGTAKRRRHSWANGHNGDDGRHLGRCLIVRTSDISPDRGVWCEVSVSPMVAQRRDVTDAFTKVGIRVLRSAVRLVSDSQRIYVIAWDQLPWGNTDDRLRLVVIADRAEESEQREAARRGAAALIAVDRLQEDLESVIRCVTVGYYPIPYRIASTLVSRLDVPPSSIGADELDLLNRLLQGAKATEVAVALGCSERHARRRLRAVWDQMGVSGRREGLATAVRWGLS